MKRILLILLKKKWYLILLIIFFAIAFIVNNPFKNENSVYTITDSSKKCGVTQEIVGGDQVTQKFTAKDNNFRKIELYVATNAHQVTSNLNITILCLDDEKTIFDCDLNLTELEDNSWLEIDIENQENSKGKEYEIVLSGIDGTSGNSMLCYLADCEDGENGYELNGENYTTKLMYKTTYLNKTMTVLNIICWGVFFIASILLVYKIGEKADEKEFLKLCVFVGIFTIIFTPFCHCLDEPTHFFKSYLISKGEFYYLIDENGSIGANISENFYNYVFGKYNKDTILIKYLSIDSTPFTENFEGETNFLEFPYLSSTIPLAHSISAIGIFLGNVLRFNMLGIIGLARISNFIVYTICGYIAIKNMKYYKSIMFMIVTIPVTFWLSATVSIDPILLGAAFVFSSICFKYYFEKDNPDVKIRKLDMILLIISECFIISVKYLAYSPLILLFFIIPKDKFKSKKNYGLLIALAIFVGILIVLWQIYLLNAFPYSEDRNGDVDIKEQIEFILENKIYTLRVFLVSIQNTFTNATFTYIYGNALKLVGNSIGIIIIIGSILEKNKFKMDKKMNIFCFLLFCLIYLICLLAEYLAYTPVGNEIINGYQYRYLVPKFILLLIPLANCFKIQNNIKNYERKLIFAMMIVNINLILGLLIYSFEKELRLK